MKRRSLIGLAAAGLAAFCLAAPATAQEFNVRRFEGQTINLLLNNHPWSQAMREKVAEFTRLTGINARIEIFNEEQFRARLTTLMQARSADIDVFMSLKPREGVVFDRAGWYADLTPMLNDRTLTSPTFNFEDFGKALRDAETINNRLIGLPINLEGPLFYWRRDIFARCNIPEPMAVEDIEPAAQRLKACDAAIQPWAARGLRGAINYALGGFINNTGGSFATPDGRPGLCQPATVAAMDLYARLLRDHGPPGALNHTFTQVIELLGQGRLAMTYESSNEFANIMRFPDRARDLGVKPLPPGRTAGVERPVVIGWGISVSAHSQRRQAAWMFLQWATSPEVQTALVERGVAPPRTSVFNGDAFRRWTEEVPVRRAWADALIRIAATGTAVYQVPGDRIPELRDINGNAIQRIVLNQQSARDAACQADQESARLN